MSGGRAAKDMKKPTRRVKENRGGGERGDELAYLDISLLVEETLGCCREAERHALRWESTHHTPSDRRSLNHTSER